MDFTILNNFFLCNDILGQIFQLILAVFSLLFNIFGIIQHSVGAIFAGVMYNVYRPCPNLYTVPKWSFLSFFFPHCSSCGSFGSYFFLHFLGEHNL